MIGTNLGLMGAISDIIQDGANKTGAENSMTLTGFISNFLTIVMFVVGIVGAVMIIMGAVQYTISQGDASKVKRAKDTILYGVIGMIIAVLAFSIVNFVLANI